MTAPLQITYQRLFSKESDYVAFASVRLHNGHVKKLGGRHAWVCISSGSSSVYRTIKGSGASKGFPKEGIELDYDTALELGITKALSESGGREEGRILVPSEEDRRPFFPCALDIRPIGRLEVILAHWKHPNPAYRIPLQISLVLGLLSTCLGVLSLIISLMALK